MGIVISMKCDRIITEEIVVYGKNTVLKSVF